MFEFMFGERRNTVRRLKKLCLFESPVTLAVSCHGSSDDDRRHRTQGLGGSRRRQRRSCCRGGERSPDDDDYDIDNDTEDRRGEKFLRLLKGCCDALLKRLSEPQLTALHGAIEAKCGLFGECVPVEGGLRRGSDAFGESPAYLACRLWRWSDLDVSSSGGGGGSGASTTTATTLRPLPFCCGSTERVPGLVVECCNPYHWCRVQRSEMPSAYSDLASERKNRKDGDESPKSSPVKSRFASRSSRSASDDDRGDGGGPWCELAYWEERTRIGPVIPIAESWNNVFGWHDGARMLVPGRRSISLQAVAAKHHPNPSDQVLQARSKIGAGISISRDEERGDVWLYNVSKQPVFLAPSTLSPCRARAIAVHRLAPGYCVKAYDRATAECYRRLVIESDDAEEPLDTSDSSRGGGGGGGGGGDSPPIEIIPISFGKGWGPKYSRRDVVSCPCWLEIRLRDGQR